MKSELVEKYFTVNGELNSTEELEIFERMKGLPIYEVIRVIDRVPLFLEEHLDRMRESAKIIDYNMDRQDLDIKKDIKRLIDENNVENLNIKLLCTDIEGMGQAFLAYFIRSFYPPLEYYREGIHTILFNYKRENPNAKIQRVAFKEEIAKRLEKEKAFEALLVNKDGYIPEGSRSNLFFVKNGKVFTASKGDVLLGITRKYIFQVCEESGIEVIQDNIHKDELMDLSGAFISGTSVNVLPISSIDDIGLNSVDNRIIKRINQAYVSKMDAYVKERTL